MKKRFLSLLLVICLVAGLMPTTVFAANSGKAIQLGTDALNESINSTNAATVYFGQNDTDQPGAWRVIGYNGNGVASAQGDMTLLAAGNMGLVKFSTNGTNTYADSNLKAAIDALAEKLTEEETAAVNKRTLVSGSYNGENTDCVSGAQVDNAVFWPLSTAEANMVSNDIRALSTEHPDWAMYYWWLRSPGIDGDDAAVVTGVGLVGFGGLYVSREFGVRPAFHLDLNSVLFTSAAAGGKSSGAAGADALTSVSDYTGNEWKLTLLDSSRSSFTVDASEAETSVEVGYTSWSIPVDYSGAQTGANEYVSALLCDSNGNVLYYGNIAQNSASGTAALNIPAGLAAGSYTLKVFSEQCNGDYKTDYASAMQEISLNITLPQETTPQAVFTAAGDNSGTLSNVDASMKYSTDGGASWTDITGATATVTGVTADKDIQVVKKGDGTATADSDVQIIDVTQAAQPAGIGKTDCTTAAQNDGTVTGVDSTMEYRLSSASEWTSISGNTVSGLANGTYEVRVKANGTVLASEVATVTIGAHTCVAQGDWQHDENGHWKLCVCGAEVDRAAHTGGVATCTEKAVCDVCGSSYGAINPNNHTGEIVWTKTATAHSSKYSCCDAVVVAEEAHEWENGVCAECGYECQHDGGTATCTEKAVCDICGEEYGEVNAASHTNLVKTEAKAPTCTEAGNIEYWYCNDCQKYFRDENATEEIALAETVVPAAGHGETELKNQKDATCTEAGYTGDKVCAVCGEILEKGETVAKLAHNYKDGKCTVCGAADPDYKPADAEIPKTDGEADSLAVLLAALFVSGGLLTAAGALRRKTRAK